MKTYLAYTIANVMRKMASQMNNEESNHDCWKYGLLGLAQGGYRPLSNPPKGLAAAQFRSDLQNVQRISYLPDTLERRHLSNGSNRVRRGPPTTSQYLRYHL